MDPFVAAPQNGDGPTDVVIETLAGAEAPRAGERQNPARDGTVTLTENGRLFVLAGGRACAVPDAALDGPAVFAAQEGFPLSAVWRDAVRPALHLKLNAHGAAALHAAAVDADGAAIAVAGWSESGKTETALALMEAGATFLSDKWTVVGPEGISAFPIGVGVRRWVLPYLPTLRRALPRAARGRMAVAGALAAGTAPLRRREGRAAEMLERGVALADRAGLTPSELREAYGQTDDPARRIPPRAGAGLGTSTGGGLPPPPARPARGAPRPAPP